MHKTNTGLTSQTKNDSIQRIMWRRFMFCGFTNNANLVNVPLNLAAHTKRPSHISIHYKINENTQDQKRRSEKQGSGYNILYGIEIKLLSPLMCSDMR